MKKNPDGRNRCKLKGLEKKVSNHEGSACGYGEGRGSGEGRYVIGGGKSANLAGAS